MRGRPVILLTPTVGPQSNPSQILRAEYHPHPRSRLQYLTNRCNDRNSPLTSHSKNKLVGRIFATLPSLWRGYIYIFLEWMLQTCGLWLVTAGDLPFYTVMVLNPRNRTVCQVTSWWVCSDLQTLWLTTDIWLQTLIISVSYLYCFPPGRVFLLKTQESFGPF